LVNYQHYLHFKKGKDLPAFLDRGKVRNIKHKLYQLSLERTREIDSVPLAEQLLYIYLGVDKRIAVADQPAAQANDSRYDFVQLYGKLRAVAEDAVLQLKKPLSGSNTPSMTAALFSSPDLAEGSYKDWYFKADENVINVSLSESMESDKTAVLGVYTMPKTVGQQLNERDGDYLFIEQIGGDLPNYQLVVPSGGSIYKNLDALQAHWLFVYR
jgi:hypothetical protein